MDFFQENQVLFLGIFAFVLFFYISTQGKEVAKWFSAFSALLFVIAVLFYDNVDLDNIIYGLSALTILIGYLYLTQSDIDEAQNELRKLLQHANKDYNEEKKILSRKLHDDINPIIILIKVKLNFLKKSICSNEQKNAEWISTLEEAISSLDSIYNKSREIIKNTRIELLDSIGISGAIESMINNFNSNNSSPKILLISNFPENFSISPDIAINIYHIIQESVINAIKYSKATKVEISVMLKNNSITISIKDDGIGFIKNEKKTGIGLLDMRERCRVINASLNIDSSIGKGTHITFSF